jgi:ABC-type amino acid transport system permease subunit
MKWIVVSVGLRAPRRQTASSINYQQIYPLKIFCFAGALYFILCTVLSLGASRLNRRLNRRVGLR